MTKPIDPDKDLPVTSLDHTFTRLRADESGRAWARSRLAAEPALLRAAYASPRLVYRATILQDLAWCHYLVGDLREGRDLTEQDIQLWEQTGLERIAIESLLRSAYFHQVGGDIPAAIAFYERVVNYKVEPLFGAEDRFDVLRAISELHAYRGERLAAVDAMRRALELAQQAGLREQVREARRRLCVCELQAERWQEALELGLMVVADFQAQGTQKLEHDTLGVVAGIYEMMGRHREAAESYEEQLRLARVLDLPRAVVIGILMKAGAAWRQADEDGRAQVCYREVVALADGEDHRRSAVLARASLVTLLCEEERAREAMVLVDEALALAPQELRARVMLSRGEAHVYLGNQAQAGAAFRQAVALAQQHGDAEQVAYALARISAFRVRGEQEAARAN